MRKHRRFFVGMLTLSRSTNWAETLHKRHDGIRHRASDLGNMDMGANRSVESTRDARLNGDSIYR